MSSRSTGFRRYRSALLAATVVLAFGAGTGAAAFGTGAGGDELGGDAVGGSGAQLNGSANPLGEATTGWFRYSTTDPGSCNDTFGTRAPAQRRHAASARAASRGRVSRRPITGLAPGTTYYFCAIASNAVGTAFGAVLSFTTPATGAERDDVGGDAGDGSSGATLNGSANPNGDGDHGLVPLQHDQPGHLQRHLRHARSGERRHRPRRGQLTGRVSRSRSPAWRRRTTYYFCAIASNAVGTTFGAVLSFTTPTAPAVTTLGGDAGRRHERAR